MRSTTWRWYLDAGAGDPHYSHLIIAWKPDQTASLSSLSSGNTNTQKHPSLPTPTSTSIIYHQTPVSPRRSLTPPAILLPSYLYYKHITSNSYRYPANITTYSSWISNKHRRSARPTEKTKISAKGKKIISAGEEEKGRQESYSYPACGGSRTTNITYGLLH